MNANFKTWMTSGVVTAVVAVLAMTGNRAWAKKETQTAGGTCDQCTEQFRNGSVVCELASCEDGCLFVCRPIGPIAVPES